jgi:hypothetical protein
MLPILLAVVLHGTSDAGKKLTLTFPEDTVTTDSDTATLCSEPAAAIDEAKLWMPVMGHGSGPTELKGLGGGCTKISGIEFLMGGTWQIKLRFPADGDHGVIDVDVAD